MEFEENMICPSCGKGKLSVASDHLYFEYKHQKKTIPNTSIFSCSECQESFINKGDEREIERLLTAGLIPISGKLEWTNFPPHQHSRNDLFKASLRGDGFYWFRSYTNYKFPDKIVQNKWNEPVLCRISSFGDRIMVFFFGEYDSTLVSAQSFQDLIEGENNIKYSQDSPFVLSQWYGPIEPPEFPDD